MAGKREGFEERLEMEEAAKASEKKFPATNKDENPARKLPRRYKLYDKIKDHVTVQMIDVIIAATVILIVAAIALGMITGR